VTGSDTSVSVREYCPGPCSVKDQEIGLIAGKLVLRFIYLGGESREDPEDFVSFVSYGCFEAVVFLDEIEGFHEE